MEFLGIQVQKRTQIYSRTRKRWHMKRHTLADLEPCTHKCTPSRGSGEVRLVTAPCPVSVSGSPEEGGSGDTQPVIIKWHQRPTFPFHRAHPPRTSVSSSIRLHLRLIQHAGGTLHSKEMQNTKKLMQSWEWKQQWGDLSSDLWSYKVWISSTSAVQMENRVWAV